jgi:hypothetical protein
MLHFSREFLGQRSLSSLLGRAAGKPGPSPPIALGRLLPTLLALLISSAITNPVLAQPAWYNNAAGVQAGIKPNLPDFYQHQSYIGDPASTRESSQPDAANFPQIVAPGGWCRPTAITDSLA